MSDMYDDPFQRQVADVARRAVGPAREVDAFEIARRAATAPSHRWGWGSLSSALQFVAGGLVAALSAGFLLLAGIIGNDRDEAIVGSSPSASPAEMPTPSATTLPPVEISRARGTFEEKFTSSLFQDVPGQAVELQGPRWFDVTSDDANLSGEATLLAYIGEWNTDLNVEREEPGIFALQARLEIRNDDGAWTGTAGPYLQAGSTGVESVVEPSDWFGNAGPLALVGSGAYEGQTAYLQFTPGDDVFGVSPDNGTFEAWVVNRTVPGFPDDEIWLREMRRTGQTE
jgi:hypothetical protein